MAPSADEEAVQAADKSNNEGRGGGGKESNAPDQKEYGINACRAFGEQDAREASHVCTQCCL